MSDPIVVWLDDVVAEMEMQSDESQAYVDRRTGELITISDDEARLVEELGDSIDSEPEGEEWEHVPAWQAEMLPKAKEVLDSDDYLPLPSRFDIHEWRIMDDFSRQVDDDAVREALLDAIHGRGAFRYFEDTIHRSGVADAWYRYRNAALEEIAIDWLKANGIRYKRRRAETYGDASGGAVPRER